LAAAGARQVDFVTSTEAASNASFYDYVIFDKDPKVTNALKRHGGLCNIGWLKQCLIGGRILPAEIAEDST
jgi:hypothetical protein